MTTAQRGYRVAMMVSQVGLLLLGGLGCANVDKVFCANGNCGWSEDEATRLAALADLPAEAPVDSSNKYLGDPAAEQLGRQFFSDPRFSGVSHGMDALQRPMPFARAPKGQALNISCYTCHDLRRGAIDTATVPGNVSLGAGWTDTNSISVINSAFYPLLSWNGRADSLWGQAVPLIEGPMGSSRLRAAWVIASHYRAEYEAVFTEYPLPMAGTILEAAASLVADGPRAGQCQLNPECPASCRAVKDDATGATGCWPRFPLDGKPGKKSGCQPGDVTEPFGDAYDCMAPDDQSAVVRVTVNFGKAIGAFEYRLVSRNSAFDLFVADLRQGLANESAHISPAAKNGARLFVGKAGCADCHNSPLLSDSQYHNVGVPQMGQGVPTELDCPKGGVCDCVTPSNCLPAGARDGIAKLKNNKYLRGSMWSDNQADESRKIYMDAAPESFARGAFRTPSLRDASLTAPYMHDGAFATLEAVVAHYNRGGDPEAGGDRSARIKPLHLTDQEQNDLVAFMKTLTGQPLPAELADPAELPR